MVYKSKHNNEITKIEIFESTCETYGRAMISTMLFYWGFVSTEYA